MRLQTDSDNYVPYPIRFRIEALSPLVFVALMLACPVYIGYCMAVQPQERPLLYPLPYAVGLFLLLLAAGLAGAAMFLRFAWRMRSYLCRYRYTSSTLEQYDPFFRKYSSIRLDDVRLICGTRSYASSSPSRRCFDDMLVTRNGETMWVMDAHPCWPEIKSRLQNVPFAAIPRDLWEARHRNQCTSAAASMELRTPPEAEQRVPKTYRIPIEEYGPCMAVFALFAAFPILIDAVEALLGQFDYKQALCGIPVSVMGVALLLFGYFSSRYKTLTVSGDGLTLTGCGRLASEIIWDQVSSVVLLRHRASFRLQETTSIVITGTDGACTVIPGIAPDAEEIAGRISQRVPEKVFWL